jgi:hypothetical protein
LYVCTLDSGGQYILVITLLSRAPLDYFLIKGLAELAGWLTGTTVTVYRDIRIINLSGPRTLTHGESYPLLSFERIPDPFAAPSDTVIF